MKAVLWISGSAVALAWLAAGTVAYADESHASPFNAVVREHFSRWDRNHDGVLSVEEVDRLLVDPSVKEEAAAALAAIHHYQTSKKHKPGTMTEDYLTAAASGKEAPTERRDEGETVPHFRSLYATYLKHMKKVPREIFHTPDAPSLQGFHQGQIGDCYFLAVVAAAVARNPAGVKRMFQVHPDGSCELHFPDGRRTHVARLTDAEIALGSTTGQQGLWLNVLEKGFGQVRKRHPASLPGHAPATDVIGSGGGETETIELLTGHKAEHLSFHHHAGSAAGEPELRTLALKVRSVVHLAHAERLLACCATGKTVKTHGVPGNHAYSVLGLDPDGKSVIVRNPWGNQYHPKGDPGLENGYPVKDGIFHVPVQDFVQIFGGITYETRLPLGAHTRRPR